MPEGPFTFGRWAWPVTLIAAGYLGIMFINVVAPTGLDSPRGALFNLDWVTLSVMFVIAVVGLVAYVIAKPWRGDHSATCTTTSKPTGAERHG